MRSLSRAMAGGVLLLPLLMLGVQGCKLNLNGKFRVNTPNTGKSDGQDRMKSFCNGVFGNVENNTIDISDMYDRPASDYPDIITAKARPVLISFIRCWKRMNLDIDGQYFKVLNTYYPELTALQAAALTGKLRAVRILIRAGADVNFGSPDSSVLDYGKQLAVFDKEFGVKESIRRRIILELRVHGAKTTWED